MKRVIQFSKARFYFFGFSALLILVGIGGFIANHGFNLGVDFKAGIELQFQVAPASFSIQYSGPDKAEISIPAGEQALTSAGNIIITVTSSKNGTKKDYAFRYTDYPTVQALTEAISKVPGISVQQKGNMDEVPTRLVPLPRPADITDKAYSINLSPGPGRGVLTTLTDVRSTLAPLGQFDMQEVGGPANQEYMVRIEAKSDNQSFQTDTEAKVMSLLGAKYGPDQVILKSSNFVGPRLAQGLVTQTIWLVVIAVALILIYMIFRFHPPIYAVAAVIGICHDALVMIGFDAVFRVEVDAATIAAILTILGYSINDTIVIFDRVRENKNLMRGSPLRTILDTSVTQTLSRTFITSGATLLTVIALFILTSGSIKNFALNMIIGIVEGTYSTFISSFIVLEWTRMMDRRHKKRDMEKYGMSTPQVKPILAAAGVPFAEPEEEAEVEPEEETALESAPEPVGASQPLPGTPADAATQPSPQAQAGATATQAQAGATATQAPRDAQRPAPALFGHSGSRKNKKHKRRHH
ncbi:MAG: protein translocase subunit SecF [Spirochaetia bacterium]|jgi:preprotein translocase subunit SecF